VVFLPFGFAFFIFHLRRNQHGLRQYKTTTQLM